MSTAASAAAGDLSPSVSWSGATALCTCFTFTCDHQCHCCDLVGTLSAVIVSNRTGQCPLSPVRTLLLMPMFLLLLLQLLVVVGKQMAFAAIFALLQLVHHFGRSFVFCLSSGEKCRDFGAL